LITSASDTAHVLQDDQVQLIEGQQFERLFDHGCVYVAETARPDLDGADACGGDLFRIHQGVYVSLHHRDPVAVT
jgi:hypothetical protein